MRREQERINNRSTAVPNSLEELVELAGQGVLEVGVEPVKGVLPQVGHLVPWVQNRLVLVSAWESQLDADAAVDRPLGLAALCSDSTSLFPEANKVRLAWTSTTTILLPVQVLKSAFLELKYLDKSHQFQIQNFSIPSSHMLNNIKFVSLYQGEAGHRNRGVGDKYWSRSRCILPTSKCYHESTSRSLQKYSQIFLSHTDHASIGCMHSTMNRHENKDYLELRSGNQSAITM